MFIFWKQTFIEFHGIINSIIQSLICNQLIIIILPNCFVTHDCNRCFKLMYGNNELVQLLIVNLIIQIMDNLIVQNDIILMNGSSLTKRNFLYFIQILNLRLISQNTQYFFNNIYKESMDKRNSIKAAKNANFYFENRKRLNYKAQQIKLINEFQCENQQTQILLKNQNNISSDSESGQADNYCL